MEWNATPGPSKSWIKTKYSFENQQKAEQFYIEKKGTVVSSLLCNLESKWNFEFIAESSLRCLSKYLLEQKPK